MAYPNPKDNQNIGQVLQLLLAIPLALPYPEISLSARRKHPIEQGESWQLLDWLKLCHKFFLVVMRVVYLSGCRNRGKKRASCLSTQRRKRQEFFLHTHCLLPTPTELTFHQSSLESSSSMIRSPGLRGQKKSGFVPEKAINDCSALPLSF